MVSNLDIIAAILRERYKTVILRDVPFDLGNIRITVAGSKTPTWLRVNGSKVRCRYGKRVIDLADPESIPRLFDMVDTCREGLVARNGWVRDPRNEFLAALCTSRISHDCPYYGGKEGSWSQDQGR